MAGLTTNASASTKLVDMNGRPITAAPGQNWQVLRTVYQVHRTSSLGEVVTSGYWVHYCVPEGDNIQEADLG